MLILNEMNVAKNVYLGWNNIDEQYSLGRRLRYVAMYMFWKLEIHDKDILQKKLIQWANTHCDEFSIFNNANLICSIVKNVDKQEPRSIDGIAITQAEIDKILELDNIRQEKLAFVMLVYAKFNFVVNQNKASYRPGSFFCELPQLFKMARVSVKADQRTSELHNMYEAGYVNVPVKVDATGWIYNYCDEFGEPAELKDPANGHKKLAIITDDDMSELAYWYMRYVKGDKKITTCPQCGKTLVRANKINGGLCMDCQEYTKTGIHTQKCVECGEVFEVSDKGAPSMYCDECAKVINRQKTQKRMRENRKNT